MFIVSEMLKTARKEANMTTEQLVEKAGTKITTYPNLKTSKVTSNFPP